MFAGSMSLNRIDIESLSSRHSECISLLGVFVLGESSLGFCIVCGGMSVSIESGKGHTVPGILIFVNSNFISI